jgi:acetyl-CoA acetyltransferase
MYQYGTTSEHLAEVAVAARKWAQMNPKAWSREPLTVEDVLSSRMICDPLHKFDCCLLLDGGGAMIITNQSRAKDAAKPVRVLGAGESHTHFNSRRCWTSPFRPVRFLAERPLPWLG